MITTPYARGRVCVRVDCGRKHWGRGLCHRHYAQQVAWETKLEVIAGYGGACVCCGEANPEFLVIDHINGGGRAHRESLGGKSADLYRYLRKNNWPRDEFRLLCQNCNMSFGMYGRCPHEGGA